MIMKDEDGEKLEEKVPSNYLSYLNIKWVTVTKLLAKMNIANVWPAVYSIAFRVMMKTQKQI